MRALWLAITLAFMAFSFATETSAQDGLKRFETDIKPQIELKSFTYGSASAQGSSGFVLNNVVAGAPGSGASRGQGRTIKADQVAGARPPFGRIEKGGERDGRAPFMELKMGSVHSGSERVAR